MSIHRLARDLGLSISTVSRALNGYTDVAEATRQRVEQRARELDYQPHAVARSLKSGRSMSIGVVLPVDEVGERFIDPMYSRLLGAVDAVVKGQGYRLVATTHNVHGAEDELALYRRFLQARWFDAHLVVRTRRDDARVALLQAADVPFVTYGRTVEGERHPWVDTDNEQAFRLATQRQIDFGHRHVALLNGPAVYMFSWLREQGYRRALEAASLHPRPGAVMHGDPTEKTGYAMARQLLAQPDPPTALLCATDAMAIGAMAACREAGLVVGRDVSVVGYGNTETGAFSDPPLTTIEHRVSDNGRLLGQLLLDRLADRLPAVCHHLEPVELVPRGSDGPLSSF